MRGPAGRGTELAREQLDQPRADRLRLPGSQFLAPAHAVVADLDAHGLRAPGERNYDLARLLAWEGVLEGVRQDLVDDERQWDRRVERQLDGYARLDPAGDPLPEGVVGVADLGTHIAHQCIGGEQPGVIRLVELIVNPPHGPNPLEALLQERPGRVGGVARLKGEQARDHLEI